MCKAPKPPKPQPPEKPEFLHNEYLDAAIGQSAVVQALRAGRSSLRIPLGSGLRIPGTTLTPPSAPRTTPRLPGGPPGPSPRLQSSTIAGIGGRGLRT